MPESFSWDGPRHHRRVHSGPWQLPIFRGTRAFSLSKSPLGPSNPGLLCFLSLTATATAQCGTVLTPEEIERDLAEIAAAGPLLGPPPGSTLYLPVQIHAIRRYDGSGGVAAGSISLAMNILNADYSSTGIQFFQACDPESIHSTAFFDASSTPPSCRDACDTNDDGTLGIADGITLLSTLFGGGALPLPPPATCDLDPTPDLFDCHASSCPEAP